jgi:hypothetical protein
MRCLVHIGTEKTGSTTLQRALRDQRASLSQQGICYGQAAGKVNAQGLAAACVPYRPADPYLLRKGLSSADAKSQWNEEIFAAVRAEIGEARADHSQYVLSSEHFSSRLLASEEVEALAQFLLAEFNSIRIVCYLRRQDRMAVSRYTEGLRSGYTTDALPPVTAGAALPALYDYESMLLRWANAFGLDAIRVRIFEPDRLLNGDVVEDFCNRELGAALDYDAVTATNVSLNATGQLALKLFNKALGPDGQRFGYKARRALSLFLEQHAPGRGKQPTRDEAKAFYTHFRAGNARLANAFLGQTDLFGEIFDDYPLTPETDNVDAAASLLKDFFASQ